MSMDKTKTCRDCSCEYEGKGSYNLYIPTGTKPNGKIKRTRFKQVALCECCFKRYNITDGVIIEWTKKG